MKDATGTTPIQRMTVVRGTLAGAGEKMDLGVAEAAAALAVKDADRIVPNAHGAQITHVDLAAAESDEGVELTLTVQGIGRFELESAALLGLTVALLSLREQAGGSLHNVHVVQSVA